MIRQQPPQTYDPARFRQILDGIEARLDTLERAANKDKFIVSAFNTLRNFDPATATNEQTARVLATLIADLKKVGRIN